MSILYPFCMQYKKKKVQEPFLVKVKKTVTFLKENPQLCICKADKGGATVAITTSEYTEKMNSLLQDEKIYTSLGEKNPTFNITNKLKNLLDKLHNSKFINDTQYKNLYKSYRTTPRIYGLVKVHKQNYPLRPIVSTTDSILSPLAKFLADTLSHVELEKTFYVKNSFTFMEFIKNVNIPLDHILISLDVTSLFTNIPIYLINKVIEIKWNEISNHTSLYLKLFY